MFLRLMNSAVSHRQYYTLELLGNLKTGILLTTVSIAEN